jgi:caffeoyl-CoA O-methyltransferase
MHTRVHVPRVIEAAVVRGRSRAAPWLQRAAEVVRPVVPMVDPTLDHYAEDHSSRQDALLAAVVAETRQLSDEFYMMVGQTGGELLAMLVHAVRPRTVLEIGTFTGYSTLAMAEAMPPDGRIISCEVDERNARIARRHIAASPYADRVEVRIGPALETVRSLPGPFDFVFIDADKTGYLDYYREALPKLSFVADDAETAASISALQRFNDAVDVDPRVRQVMLTIGDGMTVIRRVDPEKAAANS